MKLVHALCAAAMLAGAVPAAAQSGEARDNGAACAAQQPRKKKGFGLGGLISAARRAGVGDMLTGRAGNMLGSGKGSQIFGAVAGTALNAAESGRADASSLTGAVSGLAGPGRAGQVAGAVTGMVAEAAAGASAGCGAN
jgi:hypothetical protein